MTSRTSAAATLISATVFSGDLMSVPLTVIFNYTQWERNISRTNCETWDANMWPDVTVYSWRIAYHCSPVAFLLHILSLGVDCFGKVYPPVGIIIALFVLPDFKEQIDAMWPLNVSFVNCNLIPVWHVRISQFLVHMRTLTRFSHENAGRPPTTSLTYLNSWVRISVPLCWQK